LSSVAWAVVLVVAAAFVAAGIHWNVQRAFSYSRLITHNDVAGFLFSAICVIYAVVLGFVVVIVWEKYDTAVANTDAEVAAVADLYHSVAGFPPRERDQIRRELHQYIHETLSKDWPTMQAGGNPSNTSPILENVTWKVQTFAPTDFRESNAQAASIQNVQSIFDTRRLRLLQNQPAVPPVLWFALTVGAITIMTFTFLFGVQNQRTQLLMTAMLAAVVTILFIVIYDFDRPFSHAIGVSPEGWTALHARLEFVR
jgi:hypothetical protein